MAGLIMGTPVQTTDHGFGDKWAHFNPARRFTVVGDGSQLQLGGWTVGHLSLSALYEEHKAFKNRWSTSNCGFDLARYMGTTMYLQQHSKYDYIAFFDEEYETTEEFMKGTASLHPMLMLTHPKTILVKSRERAGPRRSRRVFIPRPSWWDNGWSFAKDIAQKGLFIYYFSFIDLEWPWLDPYLKEDDRSGSTNQKKRWWPNNNWKTKFDDFQQKQFATTTDVTMSSQDMETLNYGPFMLRMHDAQAQNFVAQITFFYKSKWYWGGNNLTFKTICDPKKTLLPAN